MRAQHKLTAAGLHIIETQVTRQK